MMFLATGRPRVFCRKGAMKRGAYTRVASASSPRKPKKCSSPRFESWPSKPAGERRLTNQKRVMSCVEIALEPTHLDYFLPFDWAWGRPDGQGACRPRKTGSPRQRPAV